jgi:hypothetical protein
MQGKEFQRQLLTVTVLLGHKSFPGAEATEAGDINNAALPGTLLFKEVKESKV